MLVKRTHQIQLFVDEQTAGMDDVQEAVVKVN
jgi:hypothetical protein